MWRQARLALFARLLLLVLFFNISNLLQFSRDFMRLQTSLSAIEPTKCPSKSVPCKSFENAKQVVDFSIT
jgi:hypothetical protein